jgi:hypothetical protein
MAAWGWETDGPVFAAAPLNLPFTLLGFGGNAPELRVNVVIPIIFVV